MKKSVEPQQLKLERYLKALYVRNIKKIVVFALLAVFALAAARSLAYFTDYTSFEYKGGAGSLFFEPIQDLSPPDSLTNMFPGDARDLLVGAVNAGTSAMDVRMTLEFKMDDDFKPSPGLGEGEGFAVFKSEDVTYDPAKGYTLAPDAVPCLSLQGSETLDLGVFEPQEEIKVELTLIFKRDSSHDWQGQNFNFKLVLEGRQYVNAHDAKGAGGWTALAEYNYTSDGGSSHTLVPPVRP